MLIYRSPTVVLGDFEWHLSVSNRAGRIHRQFYFRPLSAIRFQWQPMPKWRDRLHASFADRFQTYKLHAAKAIEAETSRADTVLRRERERARLSRVAA